MNLHALPFVSTEEEWETWIGDVKPIYFEREFLRQVKDSGFHDGEEIIDFLGLRMLTLLRKNVKVPNTIYWVRFNGCLIEARYGIFNNECYVFLPR